MILARDSLSSESFWFISGSFRLESSKNLSVKKIFLHSKIIRVSLNIYGEISYRRYL